MTAVEVLVSPGDEAEAWSASSCPVCTDTTPAGGICIGCQPVAGRRCIVCARRGPVIGESPVTVTVTPWPQNEPPVTP